MPRQQKNLNPRCELVGRNAQPTREWAGYDPIIVAERTL